MNKEDKNKTKYILGITAHPDDHISFAGTVIKLGKMGYSYAEIVLSDAEESGMVKGGQRLVRVDKREHLDVRWNTEFAEAARILNIKSLYRLGLPNIGIEYSKNTALTIMQIVRSVRPEIAFVHHPSDYMSDHIQAAYVSLEAIKLAAYSFRLDLGNNWRTPVVLHFEGVNPIDAQVLVDISAEFEEKLKVLHAYGSQFGDRSFQLTEGAAKYRGYARRTALAEAFEIPKNYPMWEIGGALK
ncbi:PIG-L family deacetylase [candidate division WWE3 bacterium]|uniref:PIG-L family deacetylase n=1 Tax=candidate division WWE3 bacterium TaxID=2053526 RepID=A0A955RRN9_UNCKA|nr:PIG-L family deacetylase [candidate division WWE3 bacterium]